MTLGLDLLTKVLDLPVSTFGFLVLTLGPDSERIALESGLVGLDCGPSNHDSGPASLDFGLNGLDSGPPGPAGLMQLLNVSWFSITVVRR